MATQLQIRRGTSAQVAAFTGAEGEVVVNTTNDSIHVNDGSTAGGFELARVDGSNWAITNNISTTANISFGDNDKAIFGSGSDLQIYHDGSNSYITDSGTGNLRISGTLLQLNDASFNKYLLGSGDSVTLYNADSAKLATTSTGIDVTGTVTADGLTVDGSSLFLDGTFTTGSTPTINLGDSSTYFKVTYGSNAAIGGYTGVDIFGTASGNKIATFANGGDISFYNSSGTSQSLYWDSSAESLGLGTSSPAYKLDIYGSSTTNIDLLHLLNSNNTLGCSSGIMFENYSGGGLNQGRIKYLNAGSNNSNSFVFEQEINATNGLVETMRIDSSGNVGIGTSSPSKKLVISDGGAMGVEISPDDSGNGYSRIINYDRTTNQYEPLRIEGEILQFSTGTTATEKVRIDASGNVGIGTTSPSAKIHLDQGASNNGLILDADTAWNSSVYFWNNGSAKWAVRNVGGGADRFSIYSYALASDAVSIDSSGNVGINNSNPSSYGKFVVDGTGNILNVNATSGSALLQLYEGGSGRFGIQTLDGSAGAKFTTAGTERMRIDSSGNLLVGTTSDNVANQTGTTQGVRIAGAQNIQVASTGVAAYFNRLSTDGTVVEFRRSGTTVGSIGVQDGDNLYVSGSVASHAGIKFGTNTVTPMVAGSNADNSVDLGTSSVRWQDLYLSGVAYASYVGSSGDTDTSIAFDTTNSIRFSTAGSEAARFDSSGNLLVGTTSSFGGLINVPVTTTDEAMVTQSNSTSASIHLNFRNPNGFVGSISTNALATAFNTSSDQRLKENIVDAPSASDDIDAIQVRSFDWKADGSHQKYGMVAQELQSVAPEAVSGDADSDEMMGVDYSKLVPMLVKEIQSLRNRVAQLENN